MIKIIMLISLLMTSIANANEVKVINLNQEYFNSDHIINKNDFRIEKFQIALEQHKLNKPANWNKLVDLVKAEYGIYNQVATANLLINQIPYLDGTDGSYMSPYVAFKRGGIVCKDYALIKYILLKEAGISPDDMLFMVHDSLTEPDTGQAHVVLAIRIGEEVYIANQFMKNTADKFYKDYGINKLQYRKLIAKSGIDALIYHFPIDTYLTSESLMTVKQYRFNQRKLFSLMNEHGQYKVAFYKAKKVVL